MTTIPVDGRLTSLQVLPIALAGGEIMEIVSPGNANLGNNYQVTTESLAAFFAAFPFLETTLVTSGSVYNMLGTDTRIVVDKTIGSPTSIVVPLASSMAYPFPVMIKDGKGDAGNGTNIITITFTGGQLCDGQPSLVIDNAYGWVTINPFPVTLASWYQTS
jgi:hypothetical protein